MQMTGPGWAGRYKTYAVYAALAILLVLWIQAEIRAAILRHQIGQVRPVSITLQAVDAQSKEPLRVAVQAPATGATWPKAFSTEPLDGQAVRLSWVGIEPVAVGISAEGYSQQTVTLDENSASSVVVALTKPQP